MIANIKREIDWWITARTREIADANKTKQVLSALKSDVPENNIQVNVRGDKICNYNFTITIKIGPHYEDVAVMNGIIENNKEVKIFPQHLYLNNPAQADNGQRRNWNGKNKQCCAGVSLNTALEYIRTYNDQPAKMIELLNEFLQVKGFDAFQDYMKSFVKRIEQQQIEKEATPRKTRRK